MSAPGDRPPQRVLIIKPSSLGDVVGALPVLVGLRRSFPQAEVSWLVSPAFAEVLSAQRELDQVIPFQRRRFGRVGRSLSATIDFAGFCRDLRRQGFDWVIDLQGLFRSAFLAWMTGAGVRAGFADCRERVARLFYTHPVRAGAGHAIDRNIAVARALGVDARAGDFRLSLSPQAQASARALLARHNLRPRGFVVVCPGTTWPNKVYPVRHWRKFVAELAQNVPVVLTGDGSPAEHRLCADLAECAGGRGIDLAGQTTIPQFAAVIALAGAVVCSDTAANFIGPAVGTPSVALLGPTRAEYIGPYLGRGVALRADLPCLGCRKRSCRHATCMQAIDPARVVEAVRRLLAAPAGIE